MKIDYFNKWTGFILLMICTSCMVKNSSEVTYASDRLQYDGTNLKYEICGSSENTILLLHGWAINKSFWKNQVDQFCGEYRIVTVDLPGFGESTTDRKDFSMEAYANDIIQLIDELQLSNLLVVGHSMSGSIMLEVANRRPNLVEALVGIDNFKELSLAEPDSAIVAEQLQVIEILRTDYVKLMSDYVNSAFVHPETSDSIRNMIVTSITSSDQEIALNALSHVMQYFDDAEQLMKLDKKLYLINSSEPPTSTSFLDSLNIKYEIHYIDSTLHYPMVERTEQFNQKLKMVLEEVF